MFDEREMSKMGMGRPLSVHLEVRPYNRNSPIVKRSLTSMGTRKGSFDPVYHNKVRDRFDQRLESFSAAQEAEMLKKKNKLQRGFVREENYKHWRTKQLLSTIKPPKTELDKHIIDKIKYNAIKGNPKKSVPLPDDDGDIIVERDVQYNGKPKIVYSHKLPRETKAIHKQVRRVFFWG